MNNEFNNFVNFGFYFLIAISVANIDNEFFNQTEQEKWDIDDTAERYFKAERDEDDEKRELELQYFFEYYKNSNLKDLNLGLKEW